MLNMRIKKVKMPSFGAAGMLVAIIAVSVSACGKKSTRKTAIEPPQLSGTAFASYSLKYTDKNPVLSADGARLVFVSGRGSEESNAVFKVYKLAWATGTNPDPAAVQRATTAELGRETAAAISPDGKWIAISSSVGSENAVYVQSFDTAGGERLVKKTSDRISGLMFSPDSRVVMWLASSQSGVKVEMADIGTAATDAVSAVQSIAAVTAAASAVWVGSDVGYAVAVAEAGASTVINRYAFTTLADLATVTGEVVSQDEQLDKSIMMTANAEMLGFVNVVPRSWRMLVERFGKEEDPQPTIPVTNQLRWTAATAGATSEAADPFGYETRQVSLGADSSAFFSLNRNFYLCEGDTAALFGSDIVTLNLGDKSLTRMVPRIKADGSGFEMAAGLCDNLDDSGVRRRMDDRITEFAVNGNATGSVFRMAYVTAMSIYFDANCGLKLGDPEIYLVEGTADAKTIFHLSGNQVPLASDARPEGAEACTL